MYNILVNGINSNHILYNTIHKQSKLPLFSIKQMAEYKLLLDLYVINNFKTKN